MRQYAPPLILASGSPRRCRLLERAGIPTRIEPAQVEETPLPGEKPHDMTRRLAEMKAAEVARRAGAEPCLVLGADTVVVLGGEVLGKPAGAAHALELLHRLSGSAHRVVTGLAVIATDTGEITRESVESGVTMRAAGDGELRAYVETGEPLDCAGAYAVQGEGRRLVERVEGSETNVIGLPLEQTLALLRAAGLRGVPER